MRAKQNVEDEEEDMIDDEEEAEAEEEPKKKVQPVQKQKDNWTVGQIAKETEDVIVDNETGKAYRLIDAVAILLNEVRDIKKNF